MSYGKNTRDGKVGRPLTADDFTAHVTDIGTWNEGDLPPFSVVPESLRAKFFHVSIDLTDDEREKFDEFKRDYHASGDN